MTVGSGLPGLMLRCMFAGCTCKLHFSAFHFFSHLKANTNYTFAGTLLLFTSSFGSIVSY